METNDIQSSSCITLWRQVTPDMLAVAELRQICAMRGSGKKSRAGSLCVKFSHHYAVLFRVPTWGLVFFVWLASGLVCSRKGVLDSGIESSVTLQGFLL